MTAYIRSLALLAVSSLAGIGASANHLRTRQRPGATAVIVVHVLDGGTGRPVKGQPVFVTFAKESLSKGNLRDSSAAVISTHQLVADDRGEARVTAPSVFDTSITVTAGDSGTVTQCSQPVLCVGDVLAKGALPQDYCWHRKGQPPVQAKPGDYYEFIRKVNGFDWAFHETFFGAPGLPRKDVDAIYAAVAKLRCDRE